MEKENKTYYALIPLDGDCYRQDFFLATTFHLEESTLHITEIDLGGFEEETYVFHEKVIHVSQTKLSPTEVFKILNTPATFKHKSTGEMLHFEAGRRWGKLSGEKFGTPRELLKTGRRGVWEYVKDQLKM